MAEYSPPERVRFIYDDWNMIEVAITASQKTEDRCRIGFHVGTKHTSYLYHVSCDADFIYEINLAGDPDVCDCGLGVNIAYLCPRN